MRIFSNAWLDLWDGSVRVRVYTKCVILLFSFEAALNAVRHASTGNPDVLAVFRVARPIWRIPTVIWCSSNARVECIFEKRTKSLSFWHPSSSPTVAYSDIGSVPVWHQCITWSNVDFSYTGPWFNIKMASYQYRKSHCGDKTVVRSSYLHNGISYIGKMSSLYWIRALDSYEQTSVDYVSWVLKHWYIYV